MHYVIHSDIKKEKIRSAYSILSDKVLKKQNGKEAKGKRQKRQCCASLMEGKPLELAYEAKW